MGFPPPLSPEPLSQLSPVPGGLGVGGGVPVWMGAPLLPLPPPRREPWSGSRTLGLSLREEVAKGVEEFLQPGLVPHALLNHLLLAQVLILPLDGCRLQETQTCTVRGTAGLGGRE